MKKNVFFWLVFILLIPAISVGFAEESGKSKFPEKIRIGYQPGAVLLEVAIANQWFEEEFKKEGIKVECVKFFSGPPLVEAFAGNRLEIGLIGDQPLIQARANDIDIKAIATQSKDSKSSGLLVPPGSSIKKLKDLKGKKVATKVGSASHGLLIRFLEAVGLSEKDIKLVNLDPPNMKVALASKDIDAAVVWEPWVSIFEDEKIGRLLLTGDGYKKSISVIIASGQFTNGYPEIAERILKLFQRSAKFANSDPQKAAELITEYDGIKVNVLAKIIKNRVYDLRIDDYAITSLADSTKFLRDNNYIRKDINPQDLVDTRFLKAIGLL